MSTGKKVIEAIEPELQGPIHEPFSWIADHCKGDQRAQFAALTKDICDGVETCLELVHSIGIDKECGNRPLLSAGDTDRLLRLAMHSSRLLGEAADRIITKKNQSEEAIK